MEIPITVLLGTFTITFLIITFILGILMHRGKLVFKYHRVFAYLTIILAILHVGFVIKKLYF